MALLLGIASRPAAALEVHEKLDILVYADLEYHQPTYGDDGAISKFQQHHSNIMLRGRPTNNVTILSNLEFEFAGDMTGGQHFNDEVRVEGTEDASAHEHDHGDEAEQAGFEPPDGAGQIALHSIYLQWNPNSQLEFRAGRFISPVGRYNTIHDMTPAFLTVGVSDAIYHVHALGGFVPFPEVNTGLSARWAPGLVRTTIFTGNGLTTDVNEAGADDNRSKAAAVRIETDPVNRLSGSFTGYWSKVGPEGDTHTVRSGVTSVSANVGPVGLVLENMTAWQPTALQTGTSLQASLTQFWPVVPYVRGQLFDPAITTGWDPLYIGGFGARTDIVPGVLFLKAEHNTTFTDGDQVGRLSVAIVGWM